MTKSENFIDIKVNEAKKSGTPIDLKGCKAHCKRRHSKGMVVYFLENLEDDNPVEILLQINGADEFDLLGGHEFKNGEILIRLEPKEQTSRCFRKKKNSDASINNFKEYVLDCKVIDTKPAEPEALVVGGLATGISELEEGKSQRKSVSEQEEFKGFAAVTNPDESLKPEEIEQHIEQLIKEAKEDTEAPRTDLKPKADVKLPEGTLKPQSYIYPRTLRKGFQVVVYKNPDTKYTYKIDANV